MTEYQCSRCHHTIARAETPPASCPACGGTIFATVERDSRGQILPSRSPVGGIITPQ